MRLRFCLSLHCANASLCLPLRCFFSLQHSRANLRRSPLHLKSNELSVGYIISEVILPVCACVNVYVRAHASRACVARVCNAQRDRVAFPSHLFSSFFFHCIYASNKMKSWHIEYAVNPRLVHVQQWSETATCRVHASTLTAICLESLVSPFSISFSFFLSFFFFFCSFSL